MKITRFFSDVIIFWLLLLSIMPALAGIRTPAERFDIPQGAYTADFIRDLGNVIQIKFTGDYNRDLSDKSFNLAARAVVAQEFYKNHADEYDMLLVFSDFYVDTGENVSAFNLGVRNDVSGINKPLFDNSDIYGSKSILSSYIDMAETGRWTLDSKDEKYFGVMSTALHEIMHQWVVGVHVMDQQVKSDLLIGHKDSHWSALLDSDASFMYGHDWIHTEEGMYLAFDQDKRYSALDLYLAGFYSPDEVGAIHFIESSDIESTSVYNKGSAVVGRERIFSIDDIIAAEGKRTPDSLASQKSFKAAIVYLTRTADMPDALIVHQLNQFARNLELNFAYHTGGRGIINVVNVSKNEQTSEESAEIVLRKDFDAELALYWLLSQQNNGHWKDVENTKIRDSVTVDELLTRISSGYNQSAFNDWIAAYADVVENVDDASFFSAKESNENIVTVLGNINTDGGWGLSEGFKSTVFDTATVIVANPKFASGISLDFLYKHQNIDGGWPREQSGVSELKSTALVLYSLMRARLKGIPVNETRLASTGSYIASIIDNDPSDISYSEIGMILQSDAMFQFLTTSLRSDLYRRLAAGQSVDGSWQGSVYETAIALGSLLEADLANLVVSFEGEFPSTVQVGEPVEFRTLITNGGTNGADAFDVSVYLDSQDPEHLKASQNITNLAAGHSQILSWSIDAEEVSGNQRVIVSADPAQTIAESSRSDNLVFKDYSVLMYSGAGVDIGVYASDISATPKIFDKYTENIDVVFSLRNISTTACLESAVSLWAGDNEAQIKLDEKIIPIPANSQVPARFSLSTHYYPDLFIQVMCPGDVNKNNDVASISLAIKHSIDAEMLGVTTGGSSSFVLGNPIAITLGLYNSGTESIASGDVALEIMKDDIRVKRFSTKVNLAAGQSVDVSWNWEPEEAGNYRLYASIDAGNLLAEADETNNTAVSTLDILLDNKPNLNIRASDVEYEGRVNQGGVTALEVLVRNTGISASRPTLAHMYLGKPFSSENLVYETTIPLIESGKSDNISFYWSNIQKSGDHLLYLVLDPLNAVEEAREDDNEAFVQIKVVELPDLVIKDTLISFSPAVVMKGKSIELNYTLVNAGGQVATGVHVKILVNGVEQVTQAIEKIDAYAAVENIYVIDGAVVNGDLDVVVTIDPDNEINELDETNNQVTTRLVAGDSNLYISERYISPNGDGNQDYVEIYADIARNSGHRLVVLNDEKHQVHEFDVSKGWPIRWYGLHNGKKLPDSDYSIQLVNTAGDSLATQLLTIDNNEWPLFKALSDEQYNNLYRSVDHITNADWIDIQAERGLVVFGVSNSVDFNDSMELVYSAKYDGVELEAGIYYAQLDGGKPQLLAAPDAFDGIFYQKDDCAVYMDSAGEYSYNCLGSYFRSFRVIAEVDSHNLYLEVHNSVYRLDTDSGAVTSLVMDSRYFYNCYWLTECIFDRLFEHEGQLYEIELAGPILDYTFDVPVTEHTLILYKYSSDLGKRNVVTSKEVTINSEDYQDDSWDWEPNHYYSRYGMDFDGASYGESVRAQSRWMRGGVINENGYVSFLNVMVSLADGTIEEYGSPEQGVIVGRNHFAFVTDSGDLEVRSFLDGSIRRYPLFSITGKDLFVSASLSSFSPSETELMLYFVDETPITPSSVETPWGELFGFGHFFQSIIDGTRSVLDPGPGGYRIALDLNSGEYEIKANFNKMASYLNCNISGRCRSQISRHIYGLDSRLFNSNDIKSHAWQGKSVELESPMLFGKYLSDGGYFTTASYPYDIEWLAQDGVYGDYYFIRGGYESILTEDISPISLGYGFGHIVYIDNDSLIFGYEGLEHSSCGFYRKDALNSEFYSETHLCVLDDNLETIHAANDYYFAGDSPYEMNDPAILYSTANSYARIKHSYRVGSGVILTVTAKDKNFATYKIDYRLKGSGNWSSLVEERSGEKNNEIVTTFVPETEGTYQIRLTIKDLAGNSRTVMDTLVWTESSAISSVRLDNVNISPDADQTLDSATVSFKVLKPVQVVFSVFDINGALIYQGEYSFDAVGNYASISWNGRDSSGRVVNDGIYTLDVNGYRYDVVVDRTAPTFTENSNICVDSDPRTCLSNLYVNKGLVIKPEDVLSGLESSSLQYYLNDVWVDVDSAVSECITVLDDAIQYLKVGCFNNNLYRYKATDRAGNSAFSNIAGNSLDNRLFLVRLDDASNFASEYFPAYINHGNNKSKIPIIYSENGGMLWLEYKNAAADQKLLLSRKNSETYVPVKVAIDGSSFRVNVSDLAVAISELNPLPGAIESGEYEFSTAADQKTLVSNSFWFATTSIISHSIDLFKDYSVYQITGIPATATKLSVLIRSMNDGDKRYSNEVVVDSILLSDLDIKNGVSRKIFPPLQECIEYEVIFHMEIDGLISSYDQTAKVPCIQLELVPEFSAENCNKTTDSLHYDVCFDKSFLRSLDFSEKAEAIALMQNAKRINIYSEDASNSMRHYLASSEPDIDENGCYLDFEVGKSLIDKNAAIGDSVYLDVIDEDGDSIYKSKLPFGYDNYFPVIDIKSPVNGGAICAIASDNGSYVSFQGSVIDYACSDCPDSDANFHVSGSSYSSLNITNAELAENNSESQKDNSYSVVTDDYIVNVLQPELLRINNLDGDQKFSYWSHDGSQNLTCGEIEFYVDGSIDISLNSPTNPLYLGEAGKKYYMVSPNLDGVNDDLLLPVRAGEEIVLELALVKHGVTTRIFTGTIGIDTGLIRIPLHEYSLDDGEYSLSVIATDNCGFTRRADYGVSIDTTPPDVTIIYPRSSSELYPVIGVEVEVDDLHLQTTSLFMAKADSNLWTSLLVDSKSAGVNGNFYNLSLAGLEGAYQLKLVAKDQAGNTSEDISVFTISEIGKLLSGYSIDYSYVSPNRDSIQDVVRGSLSLTRKATIILSESNVEVANIGTLPQGNGYWMIPEQVSNQWQNGLHTINLTATDGIGSEIGQLNVVIDSMYPSVIIDSSNDGRYGNLVVIVNDKNLASVQYRLLDSDDNVLESFTGNYSRQEAIIDLSMNQYSEGNYRFEYVVSDKAGNTIESSYEFIYDKTAPVISVSDDAVKIIDQSESLLKLVVSFVEEHPASLTLKNEQSSLYSEDGFYNDQFEILLDLGSFIDGRYSFTLRMTDVNDNSSELPISVLLDSRPPELAFDNDKYISNGTALDFSISDISDVEGVVLIDGGLELRVSKTGDGHIAWPSDLAEGHHIVMMTMHDILNHESEKSIEIIQDNLAPDPVPLIEVDNNDPVIHVHWVASVSVDAKSYIVYRNGQELVRTVDTFFDDNLIGEGSFVYTVVVEDFAGNTSDNNPQIELVLDTTPPVISNLRPQEGLILQGEVSFTADVIANDVASVRSWISIDGSDNHFESSSVDGFNLLLGVWDSGVFSGVVTFYVEAVDQAGNTVLISRAFKVDNTGISAPTGLTAEISACNRLSLTWDVVTATDFDSYQVWRSGSVVASGLSDNHWVRNDVGDGVYSFSVVAVDIAGNLGSPSSAVEVNIDCHAPELTISSPVAGTMFENLLAVVIQSPDNDINTIDVRILNELSDVVVEKTLSDGVESVTFDTSGLDYGYYSLIVIATDWYGNSSQATRVINKVDVTRPEPPSGVQLWSDSGVVKVQWKASASVDVTDYRIRGYSNLGSFDIMTSADVLEYINGHLFDASWISASVSAVDAAGNVSYEVDANNLTYGAVDSVFPYSPVDSDVFNVSVKSDFEGIVKILNDEEVINVIEVNSGIPYSIPLDISSPVQNLAIQGFYDEINSTISMPFVAVRSEKPSLLAAPILSSRSNGELNLEIESAVGVGEYWFYKINDRLGEGGGAYPIQMADVYSDDLSVIEYSLNLEDWIKGIRYGQQGNSNVVAFDVWNGTNWMRIPFEIYSSGNGESVLDLEHPVLAKHIRFTVISEQDTQFQYEILSAAVLDSADTDFVITDTDSLLNGLSAPGVRVTVAAISSDYVIGDASEALFIEANSDADLPEISLVVSVEDNKPVLSWTGDLAVYQYYYLVENGISLALPTEGTGVYKITANGYREGINTYSIIGVTSSGLMRSSNQEAVSLVLARPEAVTDLIISFDSEDWLARLSWSNDQSDVIYEVYRKYLYAIEFEHVASVSVPRFTDSDLQSASVYDYYVVAVDDHLVNGQASNLVRLVTPNNGTVFSPDLLYPFNQFFTKENNVSVISSFVPNAAGNIVVNNDSKYSFIASAELTESMSINWRDGWLDHADYFGMYSTFLYDLRAGRKLAWIPSDSYIDVIYKGATSALVTFFSNNKSFLYRETGRIALPYMSSKDMSRDGTVVAYNDGQIFNILYGDKLQFNVVQDNFTVADYTYGEVAVSSDGQAVAATGNTNVIIVDIADRGFPLYSYYTPVSDLDAIYWLTNERLMLHQISGEWLVLDKDGNEVYRLDNSDDHDVDVIGHYGNLFVSLSAGYNASSYELEVRNSYSGRVVYSLAVDAELLGDPADARVSGYGQLCTIKSGTVCYWLPGVEDIDVSLDSSTNEIFARSFFGDGSSLYSSSILVYRDFPEVSNATLSVTPVVRAFGRSSDIQINIVNAQGGANILIDSLTIDLVSPSGEITHKSLLDAQILVADDSREVLFSWTPADVGDYQVHVTLDANDDERDNAVDLVMSVYNEALPNLGIDIDGENGVFEIGLDTLAWYGDAVLEIKISSPVFQGNYIIDEGYFSHYRTLSWQYVPTMSSIWSYGFDVDVILSDSSGKTLVSSSQSFAADLIYSDPSELRVLLSDEEVIDGESFIIEYEIDVHTVAVFNGSLDLFAVSTDGVEYPIFSQSFWYQLDGDVIYGDVSIRPGILVPDNYKVIGRLRSSNGNLIDEAQTSLLVVSAPVIYSGSLLFDSDVVALNSECRVHVSVSASISNMPEDATLLLLIEDNESLVITVDDSNHLDSEWDMDLSDICGVLGNHRVTLSVQPEGRNAQSLATAVIRVVDVTPPEVRIEAPVARAFVNANSISIVEARDEGAGVEAVYLMVSGTSLMMEVAGNRRYQSGLGSLENGAYQISARAIDAAGNVTQTESIDVVMDKVNPVVSISGAANDDTYTEPVTIQIEVADENPGSLLVSINDVPVDGASIMVTEAGEYNILAVATDLAGNSTIEELFFTLDPVTALVGEVGVDFSVVTIGGSQLCHFRITNNSLTAISGLAVTGQVTRISDEVIVEATSSNIDLGGLSESSFGISLSTQSWQPGEYRCELVLTTDGSVNVLSEAFFAVKDVSIELSLTGPEAIRALVLVDGFVGVEPGDEGAMGLDVQLQALKALLAEAAVSYQIVDNTSDFETSMNSDQYNVYLLLSENILPSTSMRKVLWQSVLRGDSVLLTAAELADDEVWQSVTSTTLSKRIPEANMLEWISGDYSSEHLLLPYSQVWALRPQEADTELEAVYPLSSGLWQYDDGEQCVVEAVVPAITRKKVGRGHIITSGIDLALFMSVDSSWLESISVLIGRLEPVPRTKSIGEVVPVVVKVSAEDTAIISLDMSVSGTARPANTEDWHLVEDGSWRRFVSITPLVASEVDASIIGEAEGLVTVTFGVSDGFGEIAIERLSTEFFVQKESSLAELSMQLQSAHQIYPRDAWIILAQIELEKSVIAEATGNREIVRIHLDKVLDLIQKSDSDLESFKTEFSRVYLTNSRGY
jgi:hypothetical protein